MRLVLFITLLLIGQAAIARQILDSLPQPDTVTFQSGDLQLKGLLWKARGQRPSPAVLFNHGSEPKALKYLWRIAPGFLDQGYAFFVPFRRGQGLSQGQGTYILAQLDSAEKAGGAPARARLLMHLHETSQLQDQLAALAFLKSQPGIDSNKIIAAGVSFGGIQAVLIATQPCGIRAVLDFAGAAMNWEKGPVIPEWLRSKMATVKVPIYFIQAENDFSTKPSTELAAELKKLRKEHAIKIYPPFGKDARDGHGFIDAYDVWGPDVFPTIKQWISLPVKQKNR